jgi:transcriptional regulator with XRE-family HTH domain
MTALSELSAALQAKRELPPPETRRALRMAAGATLEQVARACDVTPQAVQFWENGSTPRGANLSAYLDVLRVFRNAMSGDLAETDPLEGASPASPGSRLARPTDRDPEYRPPPTP